MCKLTSKLGQLWFCNNQTPAAAALVFLTGNRSYGTLNQFETVLLEAFRATVRVVKVRLVLVGRASVGFQAQFRKIALLDSFLSQVFVETDLSPFTLLST
jgi:hypothetical protein